MKGRFRRALIALLLLGSGLFTSAAPPAQAAGVVADRVVVAAFPAMFTFDRLGTLYYAELRTGRVMSVDSLGRASPVVQFTDLCADADQGLFGLALHPGYPAPPLLYAYATRLVGTVCHKQVLRVDLSGADIWGLAREAGVPAVVGGDTATGALVTVLHSEPYTGEHIGGRVLFGADGNLWVSTGDGGNAAQSQQLNNGHGKILRLTPSGGVPLDNPFPASPVYAYGIRNVFGFDFDPVTQRLWATENGPECNDELNLVEAGGNYGWGPAATCATPPSPPANTNQDGPSPRLPELWYSPSDGPTGAAFCSGCGLGPDVEGRLLYGGWKKGEIRAVTLDASRSNVVSQSVVYTHTRAETPLSIEAAPDGTLYFSDEFSIFRLRSG